VQDFFRQSNPWALRDVAARLLEAMDRGMWKQPMPELRTALQSAYLDAEGIAEGRAAGLGAQIP